MSSPVTVSQQQVFSIVQGEVQHQTRSLLTRCSNLESRVNAAVLSQSQSSTQILQTLHSLSNKLDGKVRVLEDGISEVNRNTQTLVTKNFEEAEKQIVETDAELYEYIRENTSKIEVLASKVDSVETKISSIEGKVDDLSQKVDVSFKLLLQEIQKLQPKT